MYFCWQKKNKIKLFYPQKHRYLAAHRSTSAAALARLRYKVVLKSANTDISVRSRF